MALRNIRYRGRPRRKTAPRPRTLLTDLTVEEVSLVDRPANNRPWIIKSAGHEGADGVIDVVVSTDPPHTTALCESAYKALGAVEHALDGRGPVAKALDISEQGRTKVYEHFGEICQRFDALCALISGVEGNPMGGSLDAAVGGELAMIAGSFMDLAGAFGVTEAPEVPEPEPITRAEKAGRAMSRQRLGKLAEARAAADILAGILADLFADSGGDDTIMSAAHEMFGGVSKVADHIDDRLAAVLDALAASHSDLKTAIAAVKSTGVVVTANGTPVAKSAPTTAPGSNQIRHTGETAAEPAPTGFSKFIIDQTRRSQRAE